MHVLRASLALSLSLTLGATACGGDSDDANTTPSGGTGGASADGGSAGSGGASGGAGGDAGGAAGGSMAGGGSGGSAPAGVSLDEVCGVVAEAICAARAPCCQDLVASFDQAACEQRETTTCEADAQRARDGELTFHPEHVEGCLQGLPGVFSACDKSTLELLTEHKDFFVQCTGVFSGPSEIRGGCASDADCNRDGAENFITCDAGTCTEIALVPRGEACSFGSSGGLCEAGLYCDTDFVTDGTCEPATALGEACDITVQVNLQCGLFNYCEPSTGVCTAGKAEDAACASDIECASLSCPAGTCVGGPDRIVTAQECGG